MVEVVGGFRIKSVLSGPSASTAVEDIRLLIAYTYGRCGCSSRVSWHTDTSTETRIGYGVQCDLLRTTSIVVILKTVCGWQHIKPFQIHTTRDSRYNDIPYNDCSQ